MPPKHIRKSGGSATPEGFHWLVYKDARSWTPATGLRKNGTLVDEGRGWRVYQRQIGDYWMVESAAVRGFWCCLNPD